MVSHQNAFPFDTPQLAAGRLHFVFFQSFKCPPGIAGMVTIDAMGCQTHMVKQIIDQESDYLLTLKRNQKKSYRAVTTYFHHQIEPHLTWRDEQNFFDAFDDSHGRTVRRRIWRLSDRSPSANLDKWEELNSIVAVETIRKAHPQAE